MEEVQHGALPASAGTRAASAYRWRSSGIEPVLRLLGWAIVAAWDRIVVALLSVFSGHARRQARLDAWRTRTTRRAVDVLGRLKGVYVKAGQFAGHRHDIVPGSASGALAALRDRVMPLPFERIRPVVESELGGRIEEWFTEFEPEALGAASIAQVHRARLPSGEEVAVKIQYPWLEASLAADLAIVRGLIRVTSWFRGTSLIDWEQLFEEFAAGLRGELDFRREAAYASEIAANLASDTGIVVPTIVASHSAKRVLTMSYHEAIRISDLERLGAAGVDMTAVLQIVGRAYARQVFVDGLFHADPHPGNLFVLDEPEASTRPRVLFIDFGLSRRLDPALRREMRQGIYSVIQRDLDGFIAAMNRMGMIAPDAEADVRESVHAIFVRIADQGGALGVSGSTVLSLKDEAKTLLQDTPGLQLPNDLLLFAKTVTYVFSLAAELAPDVDMVRLCLPYLLQFLAEKDREAGA